MKSTAPGQRQRSSFPRFGVPRYARYRGTESSAILMVKGEVAKAAEVSFAELARLERVEQVSDLHCVTTWSQFGLTWSGYRFRDVHERLLVPAVEPSEGARWVVFRGADGYRTSLPLEDALDSAVLLADRMNGQSLNLEHGAPLRLVAPAHYAYKSVKHLSGIEYWSEFRPAGLNEHPRARVALEERGRVLPGRLLRYLYRPLIGPVERYFRARTLED